MIKKGFHKNIKKAAAWTLTAVMAASMAGCGGGKADTPAVSETEKNTAVSASEEGNSAAAESTQSGESKYADTLTIDFFTKDANYQGIQSGWFAKIVKDKFNLEINIIAPNISGDAVYQTRAAAGELGDIIHLSAEQMKDCVDSGLIMDITELAGNSESLKRFETGAKSLSDYFGTGDAIYAFPTNASTEAKPTDCSQMRYNAPENGFYTRWDYYYELGCPEIKNMDDMLKVSKQMQDNHPLSDSGKPAYAFSLFPDWDGKWLATASKYCIMYGYGGSTGYILFNSDASKSFTLEDEDGMYYKVIEMFYKANQMGILDPDSSTQSFDELTAKVKDGAAFSSPFPITEYNTPEHVAEGKGQGFVPVGDMNYAPLGYSPYGQGGAVAMGSNVKDPERVFEFFEWLSTPEANMLTYAGPEGLTWEEKDGRPCLTEYGKSALQGGSVQNVPVPEEWGGGNYGDGSNKLVTSIDYQMDLHPKYRETYDTGSWSSTIEENRNKIHDEWTEVYGYEWPLEYLEAKDMIHPFPGNSFREPADPSDIKTIRSECNQILTEYSWKAIYASNDDEFRQLWQEMKNKLDGFGYQKVLEFDWKNFEDAKAAVQEVLNAG